MDEILSRPAYWFATSLPLIAAAAALLGTSTIRVASWRILIVAVVHVVTLPAGFILVLMAIDRGSEMRRPIDGILALPLVCVWCATSVLYIVLFIAAGIVSARRGGRESWGTR